jgi:pantoate--beta-alanine ligase
MKIFKSIHDWQTYRRSLRETSVGFVPTMGALHQGHLSLLETSLAHNGITVVSIFVNPTQFDEDNDFEAYPVDHYKDLKRLEEAGVHAVLLPDRVQVYADNYRFKVTESEFSQQLCGAHRPGHFDGVLTVVMRLLNILKPDNAYFGEKDYQQLQLIRDMVSAFFMPVKIVSCATVREADGLAMSSRNQGLSLHNRDKAASLYSTLRQSRNSEEARRLLSQQGFDLDYVEDIPGRRLAAVRLGNTRLIDNVEI